MLDDDTELQLTAITAKLKQADARLRVVEAELQAIKQRQEKVPNLSTFHSFKKLPPELRQTIWKLACVPRLVPFNEDHDEPGFHTRIPNPPILAVSKEAREIGLRCYTKEFGDTYFNFAQDTFVVCETWRDRELLPNEAYDEEMGDSVEDNEEFIVENAPEPSILHNLRRLCNPQPKMWNWGDTIWNREVSIAEQRVHESVRIESMSKVQSIAIPFVAWQGLSSFEAKEHLEASDDIMQELVQLPSLKEIVLLVHNQPGWDSNVAYEAVRPTEGPRTAIGSSAIFRLNTNDWQTMDDYALIGYESLRLRITHMCGARLYTPIKILPDD